MTSAPEMAFTPASPDESKQYMAYSDHHRTLSRVADNIKDLAAHVHPPVPNPAPLGLIAFGLTTGLLMIKHTRIAGEDQEDLHGVNTLLLGFALFFGGLLQLLAGLGEVRRNNIFGYTAFCLYGGFWMSIGTIEIVSLLSNGEAAPANPDATQAMLFMVFLFSVMLWILTFKMNKTICVLFFLLLVTCLLLFFGVDNETVDKVGGYFGICTSANAFWLAFVELYNDVFGEGREVIPLGHWRSNRFQSTGAAHSPGRIHGHWPFIMPRESHKKNNDAKPSSDVETGITNTKECHSSP